MKHGSRMVYAILKRRVIKEVGPTLRGERNRSEWIIVIALIILSIMGSLFTGFQLDTGYINKPIQAVGVCSIPAHIVNGGRDCIKVEVQTVYVNGNPQLKNVTVPAGICCWLLNGTKSSP